MARTAKVWRPSLRPEKLNWPLSHAVQPVPSTSQSKSLSLSLLLYSKVPLLAMAGLGGVAVRVVSGGVVSTVQVWLAASPRLPSASKPRTVNVCSPAASGPRVTGLLHDA